MAAHVEGSNGKRKLPENQDGPPEKKSMPTVNSKAPRGINVVEFAEARALELHNMVQEISNADKKGSKRVFQSLPKHMRRRAASHNSKRIPARLRHFEKKEETPADPTKKKKSRRQRRKPKSLLDVYNRRKMNHIWLESHIWHAKRMKMVEVWGYKLAEHPSDKSFKACHRAISSSCLLQDISYYCCVEVKGLKADIISAMSKITQKDLGLTMASIEYINTGKEGHVMLYHPNQYPYGAIGPVSFMWRQFKDNTASLSQLWVWIHPSCLQESLDVIKNVCERPEETSQEETSENNSLVVTSLQFDLSRLRLIGPLSHSVLVDMLEIIGENGLLVDKQKGSSNMNGVCESNNNSNETTCKKVKKHLNAEELWNRLKSVFSPSVVKPHCTIGLTVLDPRIGLPGKRTSIDNTAAAQQQADPPLQQWLLCKWPSNIAASPLWDSDVRSHVKDTKIDDNEFNKLRSRILLPGQRVNLGTKASHVPVILVQQPGNQGYGAGWDIILPAGWTMPFWIALVYRGARVGGLRESRNCSLESLVTYFPRDIPDTGAGRRHNEVIHKEGENKYSRYPPDKRPNYGKLGIPSPFSCPWGTLVKEWIDVDTKSVSKRKDFKQISKNKDEIQEKTSKTKRKRTNTELILSSADSRSCSSTDDFYVLRDACSLKHIRNLFKSKPGCDDNDNGIILDITRKNLCSLVAVSLRMVKQGFPQANSTISIPNSDDLKQLENCKTYGGPVEPLHKGLKHKLCSKVGNPNALIGCCTRDVIGYVTSGQYSLSNGFGVGIGYCALPGLVRLLSFGCKGIVLVRNTSSQQYRYAYITIL